MNDPQLGRRYGNQRAQLRKLEEQAYLQLRRNFVERKPATWYRLTNGGSRALHTHLKVMRALVNEAKPESD